MTNNQSTFTQELGYVVDQFEELQDLRWSDLQYLDEYRELKMKKNDGLAVDQVRLDELELIFKNKIITSARFAKFQEALVNMQIFIKTEVEGYVLDKQQEMNTYVDTKKTEIDTEINKFDDQGNYNSSTTYYAKNFVRYNGEVYIALKTNLGITPSDNGTDWRKLSIKGEQGIAGVGLNWRGQFIYGTVYNPDDLVRHDQGLYVCKTTTTGAEYPTNTEHWDIFLMIAGNKIYKNKVITDAITNEISIGIPEYNYNTDELIISQNTVDIFENEEYTINPITSKIIKIDGTWDIDTYFYIRAIKNAK